MTRASPVAAETRRLPRRVPALPRHLTEAEDAALRSLLEVARCPSATYSSELGLVLLEEHIVPILSGQKSAAQAGRDARPLVREALSRL